MLKLEPPAKVFNNQEAQPTVQATVSAVQPAEQPLPPAKVEEVKTPVETPPEPVATHPIGCEHYRHLVQQYDWNVEVAIRIMQAESSCNPYSVGDNYPINGLHAPSCGLFQIRTLPGRPTCEELKNPEVNIAWANRLYQANGYSPWSVCNNGIARCY